jgi:hypothetical protein
MPWPIWPRRSVRKSVQGKRKENYTYVITKRLVEVGELGYISGIRWIYAIRRGTPCVCTAKNNRNANDDTLLEKAVFVCGVCIIVGQHAKSRPHIQAHLVLPTLKANAKKPKEPEFSFPETAVF